MGEFALGEIPFEEKVTQVAKDSQVSQVPQISWSR